MNRSSEPGKNWLSQSTWRKQERENLKGSRARERVRKGGRRGVAGNKRLANPRRQFNLAANPRENVNKDLATTSVTLFRPATSRGTRVLARVQRHFIFAQRYRRQPAPDHVEIVCKASCARRPFLFSRLSPLPLPLLFSSATPFGLPPS